MTPRPSGEPVGVPASVLVLWDIDQTLVDTGGVSAGAMGVALRRLLGDGIGDEVGWVDMGGRTDRAIMTEMLALCGVTATDELLADFRTLLAAALTESIPLLLTRGRVLPGALEALRRVRSSRPDLAQSVLTGNVADTARIKLSTYGLAGFLNLEAGAYGGHHTVRAELVDVARLRYGELYAEAAGPPAIVLVGDTPHDVRAARQGGAGVVAVATGRHSRAELAEAGAEVVLDDLRDTLAVMRALDLAAREVDAVRGRESSR